MLIIMDGYGLGDPKDPTNAVEQSHHKNFTLFEEMYPHTTLEASGLAVGLPKGQMGNSEVGHLNIGAGRIIYQELTRITKDVEDGVFFENPVVKETYDHAKKGALHIMGLLSDGGVHSHIDHMKATLLGAKNNGLTDVYVHAFLDGRDVPPSSAGAFISELEAYMNEIGCGKIATISGRFYAMDRDKRWDRVKKAYEAIVDGDGLYADTASEALALAYDRGETDEFVQPTIIVKGAEIAPDDTVWFVNFRPDRARELTAALTLPDFDGFARKRGKLPLFMSTMVVYEENLPVHVVYRKEVPKNTLGEVISKLGYRQLRIAETEKYAHVTYFFNGGEETPFEGEDRELIASPKVATYDLQPEMSAHEVTDKVIDAIRKGAYDMIILNYANADMVGHTGNFEAAKKAVSTVDECIGKVAKEIIAVNGHLLITADHGNADVMVNHITGVAHTAHTTNLVPLILVSEAHKHDKLEAGKLCDIAPTLLDLAHIKQPAEMTGKSLLISSEK